MPKVIMYVLGYILLILVSASLPFIYLISGLRRGSPEWMKWYPSWLWIFMKRNDYV